MAKIIISFLILAFVIAGIIQGFTVVSGRERIQLIKLLGYTMLITVVTASVVAAIVTFF